MLISKIDQQENNPGNSSTTKVGEHIPCGYSMAATCGFDHIEDKHTLYRGKDIIDFEKKKILPLTRKELKWFIDADLYYICIIRFLKIPL